jgi:hypothetical protein
MYMCLFIKLSDHTYINIYVYIVLLKKLSHTAASSTKKKSTHLTTVAIANQQLNNNLDMSE